MSYTVDHHTLKIVEEEDNEDVTEEQTAVV